MANFFPPRAISWPKALLMAALLGSPAAVMADPPLAPFALDYHFKSSGVPFAIKAQRSLIQMKDGLWKVELHAKNFIGEIRETALFNWQGCTPRSRFYGYHRQGLGRVKEAQLRIDPDTGMADSTRTDKPQRHYPVSEDTTDELSVPLALQCELRAGETDIELNVADERSSEPQRYKVISQEQLDIDGHLLDTVKLQRIREANSSRQTFMWFAPEHDYLLVKLVQENSDGEHILTLQSLEGL